jgi:hypothetical protein
MRWNPLKLTNLLGWWDASDAATFTYGTGSTVAQWNDKSGNGRHLTQGTAASRPDRNATLNGQAGVTFDGSNDYLDYDAGSDILDINPWTLWVVVDIDTGEGNSRIMAARRSATGTGEAASPNAILLYVNAAVSATALRAFSDGSAGPTDNTGVSTAMIAHSRHNGTTSLTVGHGGVEQSPTVANPPAAMRYLRVGGTIDGAGNPPANGDTNAFGGVIYEAILCGANVTDMTAPIAYFEDKWGL